MAEDVEVEIFGQVFRVAVGEASATYIRRLAAHVDERMRAVSDAAKTTPLTRIAILTALNIADDLLKLREHLDQSADFFNTKTDHLIALVENQLDD
ncbi:MAG: cell division protein ZapA [bacterium]|nr:cell division protein ZapA [bacterium]